MTVRQILKMGDPRLLRVAQPVTEFDTDALHLLVTDLLDTMAAANGAGLAAPQIGVDLQVVIFGSGAPNPRYPDAPIVPRTVLCNPVIMPLGEEEELGWEGCLSVPGLRGVVPRWQRAFAACRCYRLFAPSVPYELPRFAPVTRAGGLPTVAAVGNLRGGRSRHGWVVRERADRPGPVRSLGR